MKDYILVSVMVVLMMGSIMGYIHLLSWIMSKFGRTDQIKSIGVKMRAMVKRFNKFGVAVGFLLVLGGGVVASNDYKRAQDKAAADEIRTSVTNCMSEGMLDGTCEAS